MDFIMLPIARREMQDYATGRFSISLHCLAVCLEEACNIPISHDNSIAAMQQYFRYPPRKKLIDQLSPQGTEELADILDQQLRLFPEGKVAAAWHGGVVDKIIAALENVAGRIRTRIV